MADSMGGRRPRPRVALFGEFGIRNLGNEATLRAFIAFLHEDAELDVLCTDPGAVDDDVVIPRVPIHPPGRLIGSTLLAARVVERVLRYPRLVAWLLSRMGRYDLVVVAGTGIFEDAVTQRAHHTPLTVLTAVLAARARGVPVAIAAVGVTPATSAVKRLVFGTALRSAGYRSYRDRYSARAAAALGVSDRDPLVYGDVVMGAPAPPADHAPGPGSLEVMIGIIDHPDGQDERYPEAMAALVVHARRRGYRPWLTVGEPGDLRMADRVNAALRRDAQDQGPCEVVHLPTLAGLEARMSDVGVAVVARYHHLVATVRLGIPTIAIGYSPKFVALAERYGLARFNRPLASISAAEVVADFDELIALGPSLRPTLATAHHAYLADVVAQADDLRSLVAAGRTRAEVDR